MQFTDVIKKVMFVVIIVALVVAAIFVAARKSAYERQIVDLQNAVAERDKTIEVQKNVYQKLSVQNDDLSTLLSRSDEQLRLLRDQLKKTGDELLAANTLIVKLRKDLQSNANANQEIPDPQKPGIIRINFDSKEDFSPFKVVGSATGDCALKEKPSVTMKLSQLRPLRLNVVVSQGDDGTWRTSTTSSEDNFQIDIALAGVNPRMLDEKWYEKIGIDLDLGVGTGPGFLAGTGVTYGFGKFEVGPKVWVTLDSGKLSPFFGAQLLWHPFKR